MDQFARREMWTFLQSKRKGRVIMVSTDMVEEAEVLADRAAVLACGELAACGSRDFLAETFSCGYVITAAVDAGNKESIGSALQYLARECGIDLDVATQVFTSEGSTSRETVMPSNSNDVMDNTSEGRSSFAPSLFGSVDLRHRRRSNARAKAPSDDSIHQPHLKHATLRLPFSVQSRLPMMIRTLESWKEDGNIKDYNISVASLRDAFLHASRLGTFDIGEMLQAPVKMPENIEENKGKASRFSQLKPMIRRRWLLAWNNRPVFWFSLFGPSVLMLAGYGIWRWLLDDWTPSKIKPLPTLAGVIAGAVVNIAYMLLGLFSTDFLVKERADKIKQQLYVSGGSKFSYWFANLSYDLFMALIPAGIIAIIRNVVPSVMTASKFPEDPFFAEVTINESLAMILALYAVGHAFTCMLVSLLTTQRWKAALLTVVFNAYASFLFALFLCLYGISESDDTLFNSLDITGQVLGSLSPLYPVMTFVLYPAFKQSAALQASAQIFTLFVEKAGINAGYGPAWFTPYILDEVFPSVLNFSFSEQCVRESLQKAFNPDIANDDALWRKTMLYDEGQTAGSNAMQGFIKDAGAEIYSNEDLIQTLTRSGERMLSGYQLIRLIAVVVTYAILAIIIEITVNSAWWRKKGVPTDDLPEHAQAPKDECVEHEEERVETICNDLTSMSDTHNASYPPLSLSRTSAAYSNHQKEMYMPYAASLSLALLVRSLVF